MNDWELSQTKTLKFWVLKSSDYDENTHFLMLTLQFFSKMAEEMVARFLGKHCPTTRQLAAFVATKSSEVLPAGALARILHSINRDGVELENKDINVKVAMKGDDHCKEEGEDSRRMTDAGTEEFQKEKGKDISGKKETIMSFLAFTNFPENMRIKMVETFFEQAF